MTCKELYVTSPEFRSMIKTWVYRRQCPLPMSDFLRELGMEAAADAALWAATTPKRARHQGMDVSFPYPGEGDSLTHRWFRNPFKRLAERHPELDRSHHVPFKNLRDDLKRSASITEAILWLLDNWKVPS